MTAEQRARRRTYRRRALVCLVSAAMIFSAAHLAHAKWRVAVDRSEHACLYPYRWFLVSLGVPDTQPGQIVTFKAKGIPLYEDGTLFTKQVLAGPGATVQVGPFGVKVDGVELPFTDEGLQLLASSGPGTAFDQAREFTLAEGEIFVTGSNPRSYDSRYYGPVSVDQLVGSARPLW